MANLQSRIETRILAETLPIAGNRLAAAAAGGETALTATENLGLALSVRLAQLAQQATQTDTAVIQALQSHLAAEGFAGVVVGITVLADRVTITLGASHTDSYVQTLTGDLGLGGLQVEADGSASVEAAFTYDLTFGTQTGPGGGFFFDASGSDEVSLSLEVGNLDLGGSVSIDGQDYAATDAGSLFSCDIAINVTGGSNLTAAQVATAGITGTLTGGADIAIDVGLVQAGFVPELSAIFDVDWNFTGAAINPDNTNASFGNLPVVTFQDVTMDLGGFMERFVGPLITQLQDLLEPLVPIVEILDGNIALLDDFPGTGDRFDDNGDGKVTLIDLIGLATNINTAPVQALADLITDVNQWVNLLDGLGFAEGNLNLGDVTFDGDPRGAAYQLIDAIDGLPDALGNLSSVVAGLTGGGWNNGGRDVLQNIVDGEIFSLPVLTDPTQWIRLLLGGDADLIGIDLPEINVGTGGPVTFLSIPLFLGINLNVGGSLNLNVDLDFGFNTRGLTDPSLNAIDGFFIVDGAGAEVSLSSGVSVAVSLGLGVLGSISGGGEITGVINMELIDGDTDGRLYLDEFIAALEANPFGIFTGTGQIGLEFFASATALGIEVWRWTSPTITLGNFSFGGLGDGSDWNLGARTGGSLLLHVGDEAGQRTDLSDRLDRAERTVLSMAADGETLQVQMNGIASNIYRYDSFTGINRVNADGGQFDDEIVMAAGMLVQANFSGGSGNDVLSGGDLVDTLSGGTGNDALFGYRGADILYGGDGDDLLNGGVGVDTLYGGAGSDRVSYVTSAAAVTVNLTTGINGGGQAAGDVLVGIEHVDGSDFNDSITGSQGAGQIFGFAGDDTLTSGTHAQLLAGGDGNDRLESVGVNDTLVGGQGNDTYVVRHGSTVISEDLLGEIGTTYSGLDRVEAWVNFGLGATDLLIEDLVLFGAATHGWGNAASNRITGNGNSNILYGGDADDTLLGGAAGLDYLDGGLGNDSLYGGTDNDTLLGNGGNDRMFGGDGNDTFYGGTGNDTLAGGAGDDFYVLGAGDSIEDSSVDGTDFVWANVTYTINAGQRLEIVSVMSLAGQDWATAYAAADRVAALRDLIDAHGAAPVGANLNLTGGFRADVLIGYGAGTNTLAGLGGADTLIGDANDTASYAASGAGIDIDMGRASQLGGDAQGDVLSGITRVIGSAHADAIRGSLLSLPILQVAEVFYGEGGNDTLTGLFGNDSLFGGNGIDVLYGGNEDDRLDGGANADSLFGGTGNDALYGGDADDLINGGAGEDTMTGGAGSDVFHVDSLGDRIDEFTSTFGETNTVIASASFVLNALAHVHQMRTASETGTAAINLTGNGRAQTITGNAGANRLDGGGGSDTLIGGAGNDVYITDGNDTLTETAQGGVDKVESAVTHVLAAHFENLTLTGTANINGTGNAEANRIIGNAGDNVLRGGLGADTMLAGAGNDTYVVDAFDTITELSGQGRDLVESSVSWTLGAHLEDLTLTGPNAINGTGNGLGNLIIGNAAANEIRGGGGRDTMAGGGGNDRLFVDNADDQVMEAAGEGSDTVLTGVSWVLSPDAEVEVLRTTSNTGTTAINLTGNAFAQTLVGNAGDNRLNGGQGSDTLTGGGGEDSFVFSTALGSTNIDRITDFVTIADTILLDDAVFAGLATGTLAAGAFASNLTGLAGNASHRIIYETDTGRLYFDEDGTGAAARMHFATLSANLLLLNSNDFEVI